MERAIPPAPQVGTSHPHGHDPQVDKLAACPSEPPQSLLWGERRVASFCLKAAQTYERGALHFLLISLETFCPKVEQGTGTAPG